MVNKKHIQVSIDAVKAQKKFDMSSWFQTRAKTERGLKGCGTSACIAGCTALQPEYKESGLGVFYDRWSDCWKFNDQDGFHVYGFEAMEIFWECSGEDAGNICTDEDFYGVDDLKDVTKDMALKALRYLKKHGTTEDFKP